MAPVFGADKKTTDWQVPQFEDAPHRRAGWVEEQIQDGEKWLKGQKSIANISSDISCLMGDKQTGDLHSNTLKTDIRTFVETISDIRKIADYATRADQFRKNVETYNNVLKHVYWASNFTSQCRKALQYAMLGRGYIWPHFTIPDYGWANKGHIEFEALGPLEVLPTQLPVNNDIQGSYAVTIIRPMPIAEAHARFPQFQQRLNAIERYDWKSYGTQMRATRMDFFDRWKFGEEESGWEKRYCEIRYTFVRDLRINTTGSKLFMGTRGTSWGYEVPSKGDLIVNTNPFNGIPESHAATDRECRMYPQLRLIITNPGISEPLYDGPAFDWHGKIPVVSYDVDDWPWTPIGSSVIHGVASLEKARRDLLSKIDEVITVRLNPPTGYNMTSGVKRDQIEKMDLLKSSGYRFGVNGEPGKAIQSVLPDSINVSSEHFKTLELIQEYMNKQLGLNDISSLKSLKMNLSNDSMDKIIENLGPIAKGIAGNMAIAHGKIAEMMKYMIPQYYTTQEVMGIVGLDGVSIETFDYDPNSLIPGSLPGEKEGESRYSKMQRAKWFCENLQVLSTPTQLLNVTQMQERMMYMLFLQKGAPVSMSTIMEKLGVQNYGTVEGDTEREKWKNEQMEKALFEIQAKIAIAMKAKELGINPEGQEGQQGKGQGKGGGRPPSGQNPPKMEMRGTTTGNQRAIVSQSK